MGRPSSPLLQFLREITERKGLNASDIAIRTGLKKARVRRILNGTESMLVDELLLLGQALEVEPSDLALGGLDVPKEGETQEESAPDLTLLERQGTATAEGKMDPWGNPTAQLIQAGFDLGCDFVFLADTSLLRQSSVPDAVLRRYTNVPIPIRLDATFHQHNQPLFDESGLTIKLSFDAVYTCHFPWQAIREIRFVPDLTDTHDAPSPTETDSGPNLRLVD